MNHLLHRAAAATNALQTARTPLQKHVAREEAYLVKRDLEQQVASDAAIAAFKKAKPQNTAGMFKGEPVHDRPVFMTGPAGTRITGPIKLPDGSSAAPNPQGQIVVPMQHVPAMIARGFVRANSVMTNL